MASKKFVIPAALAGVAAIAGGALMTRSTPRPDRDDGPEPAARGARRGYTLEGKTVTISKPDRAALYAFWRDFANLPQVMENLEAVEVSGPKRSRWTIRAPGGGTVTVESEVTEERAGELIAWRSVEGSDVTTEGKVSFADAPGDRGTRVTLEIAYQPPMGVVGQAVAKLLQREPAIQARRDLRRFQMLMETGEIATSHNRKEKEAA